MHQKSRRSGEAVAILISVWLGLAALTGSHIWSMAYPVEAKYILMKMASWMPGFYGIGVYAGKETIGLLVWLSSWFLFHLLLRHRDFRLKPWIYGFFIGFIVILLSAWPPAYHAILGWPPGMPE